MADIRHLGNAVFFRRLKGMKEQLRNQPFPIARQLTESMLDDLRVTKTDQIGRVILTLLGLGSIEFRVGMLSSS